MHSLITKYFLQQCTNVEILAYLHKYHGITISLSTLKRKLVTLGLPRRVPKGYENTTEITDEIRRQLIGSTRNLGNLIFYV